MSLRCEVPGCNRHLKNKTGLTQHMRRWHPGWEPAVELDDAVQEPPDPVLDSEPLNNAGEFDADLPPLDPTSGDEGEGSAADCGQNLEQSGHDPAPDNAGDERMSIDRSVSHHGGEARASGDIDSHMNDSDTDHLSDADDDMEPRGDADAHAEISSNDDTHSDSSSSDSDTSSDSSSSDSDTDTDFEDPDYYYDPGDLDYGAPEEGEAYDSAAKGNPAALHDLHQRGEAPLRTPTPPSSLHNGSDEHPTSPLAYESPTASPTGSGGGASDHRRRNEDIPSLQHTSGSKPRRRDVHPVINGGTYLYNTASRRRLNYLLTYIGRPCNSDGETLPAGSPPPPPPAEQGVDDWAPFEDRVSFELADLLYRKEQMPAGNINELLELWAATLLKHGGSPPFRGQEDLYKTIDNIPLGDVKWESFTLSYSGELPASGAPPWMTDKHSVFYRDPRAVVRRMIENPDFKDEIDFAPFREFDHNSKRRLQDFMGGEWAWRQANIISEDPAAQNSSFVPVILGSDKTTVSVATGQNEYYPVYCSIGNVHNGVRRAHRNAVALIGFLAIPKTNKRDANDASFRKFRRQLFHTSLSRILQPLRPWMEKPDVVRCGDGHFRKVIYGLGPYIADYPEQALLACIVQGWCPICMLEKHDIEHGGGLSRSRDHTEYLVQQFELGELWEQYGIVGDVVPFTNNFPRADIHELLAPDILHQLIKGTFKDHLVTWVEQYLKQEHGDVGAAKILAQIDRRIATVPPFSKLRHFHEGRGFKQWTGDDSKALMKVYLPAIDGLLPPDIVKSIKSFLEFCYLVRRDSHTEETIAQMEAALQQFSDCREFFRTSGVRSEGFALPRQHSRVHYVDRIWDFGSPNGLCSSITESKHIKAVKEPWRRSSRYEALGQMLMTNQRLDKLAAARVDFTDRGMMHGSCLNAAIMMLDPERREEAKRHAKKSRKKRNPLAGRPGTADDDGAVSGPTVMAYTSMATTPQRTHGSTVEELSTAFAVPNLLAHIRRFLYHELNRGQVGALSGASLPLDACPHFEDEPLTAYYSAASTFYAPSDPCGIGGMHREIIRANPSWRGRCPRFDCVFVNKANGAPGLSGMEVARVRLFFAFTYRRRRYPCAVVHWFRRTHDEVDEDTGMWTVEPSYLRPPGRGRTPLLSVIHLNNIVRAAHLIGSSLGSDVSETLKSEEALDKFSTFYVNKYADHHSFELLHHVPAPHHNV